MANLIGNSSDIEVAAVKGTNTSSTGAGVEGDSNTGWGVYGHSINGRGVVARSESNYGLRAHSTKSAGMRSSSDEGRGAEGWNVFSLRTYRRTHHLSLSENVDSWDVVGIVDDRLPLLCEDYKRVRAWRVNGNKVTNLRSLI